MRLPRPIAAPLVAALLLAVGALPAAAHLLIDIDKSSQRMTVVLDGAQLYQWPVSTGKRAYDTPSGTFTPFRMEKKHFSREWDDAPMPHSIFFTKVGHAIHGTGHLRAIGRPASHGCVRLQPQNARVLFDLVKQQGMANTRVVLEGATPAPRAPAVARRTPRLRRQPSFHERDRIVATAPTRGARAYRGGPEYRSERLYRDEREYRDDTDYRDARAYRDARDYRDDYRTGYRTGYWLQYPDGTRVFYDRERVPRSLSPRPPFFFLDGPFGRD